MTKQPRPTVERRVKQAGDRVGAISHSEGKRLFVFGYGVYLGHARPSECEEKPVGWMGDALVESDAENPLIRLDDGQHVWGCECWWGSEAYVKEKSKDFEVELISIAEKRSACG